MAIDFYSVLELSRNATNDDVKKAYRRLAMIWHPDKHFNKQEAEAKFKQISEAYRVSSEPEKRQIYDSYGDGELKLCQFPPPPHVARVGFSSNGQLHSSPNFLFSPGYIDAVDAGIFGDISCGSASCSGNSNGHFKNPAVDGGLKKEPWFLVNATDATNGMSSNSGPIDTSVLFLQHTHISSAVWKNNLDSVLRVRRSDNLVWDLYNRGMHPRVRSHLQHMGFFSILQCGNLTFNNHLVTALVERWRRETHTFHLRVGEATITLQDVSLIWGLNIDGLPVTGTDNCHKQEDIRNYIDNSIKHGVQLSTFRKERIGCDSHGISYRYENDNIIGHRHYREIRKVEVKKGKGKNVPPIPHSSYQWETVVTHLEKFLTVSMEGTIAKDLYSGIPSTSIEDIGSTSAQAYQNLHESEPGDLWYDDDDSSHERSVENLKTPSDMDREWQRRHDLFHTIGYRDGLIAGKEASAQEGFNSGFKDSISISYNWGLARGITSAMAFLPHGLKEKMVETEETRNKFQRLHKSIHSLSTTDALKLFSEYQKRKPENQDEEANHSSSDGYLNNRIRDMDVLQNYYRELWSLVGETHLVDATIINESIATSLFTP